MKKIIINIALLLSVLFLQNTYATIIDEQPTLNDKKATTETVQLYQKLKRISENEKTVFGHQDDLAYGYHWWGNDSDIKQVTGDYPGLYGWDMGHLGEEKNLDGVAFTDIKKYIEEAYLRGGITTLSWHMINLKMESSSWDKTAVVDQMLKGGKYHKTFVKKLDLFADFVNGLEVNNHKIPVLFRPWHEHNGSWFWWGAGNCSKEDYKKLWQFTVNYLREKKNVHNIIYVYSTDAFKSEEEYLDRYPGDEYVDILGFDDYGAFKPNATKEREAWVVRELETVAKLADAKNKLCAFTESGLEAVTDDTFFTKSLLSKLNHNEWTKKAAYVMLWRNANYEKEQRDHFYVPYKGHSSASDFINFKNDESILFEADLKELKLN
ncbi:beta-mannosidase [Flammeovirga pectinis]|uniref:Mannan endo-1,4-beta-mannosidase n=1 Tax=Flammeovirga pectinis TaxID=2494373 RepID=A0A3Q9FR09_9BACT|nr:glycosyl hydrolase [Flammeovirga pectinis]AZQ63970.1 beta-mannosidase [Flammeovirga pectinis]